MTLDPVNSYPIVFTSNGTTLAGRIHRPAADLTARSPAVLVTGSWLTVKEQMADRYAAERLHRHQFRLRRLGRQRRTAAAGRAAGTEDRRHRRGGAVRLPALLGYPRRSRLPGSVRQRPVRARRDRAGRAGPRVRQRRRVVPRPALGRPLLRRDGGRDPALASCPGGHGAVPAYRAGAHGPGVRSGQRRRRDVPGDGLLRQSVPGRGSAVAQRDGGAELAALAHLRRAGGGRVGHRPLAVRPFRRVCVPRPHRDPPEAAGRTGRGGLGRGCTDRLLRPADPGGLRHERCGRLLPGRPARPGQP